MSESVLNHQILALLILDRNLNQSMPKMLIFCKNCKNRPGAQALGAHQHTFCSHLKTRFKQKFRPKCA